MTIKYLTKNDVLAACIGGSVYASGGGGFYEHGLEIEEEAEKLGIKKKTLTNAKMELGIDSVKRGNQWYWMLSE